MFCFDWFAIVDVGTTFRQVFNSIVELQEESRNVKYVMYRLKRYKPYKHVRFKTETNKKFREPTQLLFPVCNIFLTSQKQQGQ